jgi:hypothetical protein
MNGTGLRLAAAFVALAAGAVAVTFVVLLIHSTLA